MLHLPANAACGRLSPTTSIHKRKLQIKVNAGHSMLKMADAATESSLQAAIVDTVADRRWGADDMPQQRQQVLDLVDQLQQLHRSVQQAQSSSDDSSTDLAPTAPMQQAVAPTEGSLDGHWQLVWTTESAVHKLVKGQLLGIPVQDIQQQIDLRNKRVINTMKFGILGLQLQASGPLTVLNSTRIYYSFDKIMLGLLGLQLSLPLFIKGGGWTDCVFMSAEEDVRVMENSRRDTLILARS